MKKPIFLSAALILLLFGCDDKPTIEGLWLIESVKVGNEDMTPNARWTRFNADHTQESGNGKFEHSHGTWAFDPACKELSIVNTNGLEAPYDPFKVSVSKERMTWERVYVGQAMTIDLVRTNKLPETHGDQLLGLWRLEELTGTGKYFGNADQTNSNSFVFFRWDKRFVIQSDLGRINGVYNVHGHKSEVELIPYGENLDRDFWDIKFEEDAITLTLLNSEETIQRRFIRTNKFPD
ncbi:MAG: hypothetical protein HRT74_12540 [Flavobacteriales bacterium]|nr:hypothetical protein [Flavobacteriales bacterium]